MHRILRPWPLLLLPFLLSACAASKDLWYGLVNTTQAYQEPTDGPRTPLRLSLSHISTYRLYPGATCIDHAQAGSGVAFMNASVHLPVPSLQPTKGPRDLGVPGMPLPPGFDSRDVWVRSGEPVVLSFWTDERRGDYITTCNAAVSFVPAAGTPDSSPVSYQAVATWNGPLLRDAGCSVRVFERGSQAPKPVVTTPAPMCSALARK